MSQERLNAIKKILLGIEANKTDYSDLWHYENMLEKAGIEVAADSKNLLNESFHSSLCDK